MEQKTKKTTNFLKNIGNGKSLPEIERENDEIDEYLFPQEIDPNAIK